MNKRIWGRGLICDGFVSKFTHVDQQICYLKQSNMLGCYNSSTLTNPSQTPCKYASDCYNEPPIQTSNNQSSDSWVLTVKKNCK